MVYHEQVRQVLSLTFEILRMQVFLLFYVLRAAFRLIVPPTSKDFSGEVVLVTGSGHGIGRELALRFAKLGAHVVCVDIDAKGNGETISMIKKQTGKSYQYECDVTDRAAIMELAEKVKNDIGDVTILVNNAGIMPCKPILQHKEQEIRKMMDINVLGNLWTIQAFMPSMVQKNQGHIVALSSIAGIMGQANLVPYCGSKYAVKGIMEALDVELSYNKNNQIKLTTICPFIVNTGLCQKPHIRFPSTMKVQEPGHVADMIIDAVRRNYSEITVPAYLHYTNRYLYRLLPDSARELLRDFFRAGVDPHDD